MNTNRLSKGLQKLLNEQMTKEAHSAQIYLSYAVWADNAGFSGISKFLLRHAREERDHMQKFVEYILERGSEVKIESIPAPPANPKNLRDCFESIFKHEVSNTKSIYNIIKQSQEEGDWATWNFAQWFAKEQTEEEKLAMDLLAKIKLAGGENADSETLYTLDRDLGNSPDEIILSRDRVH